MTSSQNPCDSFNDPYWATVAAVSAGIIVASVFVTSSAVAMLRDDIERGLRLKPRGALALYSLGFMGSVGGPLYGIYAALTNLEARAVERPTTGVNEGLIAGAVVVLLFIFFERLPELRRVLQGSSEDRTRDARRKRR